jgi:hypothetical protein
MEINYITYKVIVKAHVTYGEIFPIPITKIISKFVVLCKWDEDAPRCVL